MPVLSRGMQFTENEWAYALWHVGWRPHPVPTGTAPSLWVRLALDTAESQRDSGAYLERKKNTAGGPADSGTGKCVGYDIGISMYNERLNGQAAALPDAFVLFDWMTAARATLDHALANPTNPFGPWMYPTVRTDTSLGVAAIAARVGPNPYAIERSPYWRMKALGVPVHDLPEPPREQWVSPLPDPPLRVGQSGTPTSPLGIRINTLQRRCAFEDAWITKTGAPAGAFNWYYGSDWLKSSVALIQSRLASCGVWDGPLDGVEFSTAMYAVWDGVLRYNHMIGG